MGRKFELHNQFRISQVESRKSSDSADVSKSKKSSEIIIKSQKAGILCSKLEKTSEEVKVTAT